MSSESQDTESIRPRTVAMRKEQRQRKLLYTHIHTHNELENKVHSTSVRVRRVKDFICFGRCCILRTYSSLGKSQVMRRRGREKEGRREEGGRGKAGRGREEESERK